MIRYAHRAIASLGQHFGRDWWSTRRHSPRLTWLIWFSADKPTDTLSYLLWWFGPFWMWLSKANGSLTLNTWLVSAYSVLSSFPRFWTKLTFYRSKATSRLLWFCALLLVGCLAVVHLSCHFSTHKYSECATLLVNSQGIRLDNLIESWKTCFQSISTRYYKPKSNLTFWHMWGVLIK